MSRGLGDVYKRQGMLSSNLRKVSGSLLFGRSGDSYSDYLTRYSNQISLVSDERKATFFNWLKPGLENHSNSNVFLSSFLKPEKFNFDTNINGLFIIESLYHKFTKRKLRTCTFVTLCQM